MSVREESTVGQHTTDNPTTVGAKGFEAFVPRYEAAITKNLRDAGAIVVQTNLSNKGVRKLPNFFLPSRSGVLEELATMESCG